MALMVQQQGQNRRRIISSTHHLTIVSNTSDTPPTLLRQTACFMIPTISAGLRWSSCAVVVVGVVALLSFSPSTLALVVPQAPGRPRSGTTSTGFGKSSSQSIVPRPSHCRTRRTATWMVLTPPSQRQPTPSVSQSSRPSRSTTLSTTSPPQGTPVQSASENTDSTSGSTGTGQARPKSATRSSCSSSSSTRLHARNNNLLKRKNYQRNFIPESEREVKTLRRSRQAKYEQLKSGSDVAPNIWSFESLFPDPVWDETSVQRDLYQIKERDEKQKQRLAFQKNATDGINSNNIRQKKDPVVDSTKLREKRDSLVNPKMRSPSYGGSSVMRLWREPKLSSLESPSMESNRALPTRKNTIPNSISKTSSESIANVRPNEKLHNMSNVLTMTTSSNSNNKTKPAKVDADLTRLVRDRIFGYRRTKTGQLQYDTSLMGDGAVQFRDGVRLSNPLRVNADRLNYLAKKELQHGRVEEAQELYTIALQIDPRDGRAYLGMSRCASRRRDFKLAKVWLQTGISNAVSVNENTMQADRGANPFLLQALGCLEENSGRLSEAEALYIAAAKSRPTHAAAWVSLGQLRIRKLGQSANAGRVCFQSAEREWQRASLPPSAHVYTAWAALECEANDIRRARQLYKAALDVDPRSSVAWLQLGVMEADEENWNEAETCFETALKFDRRNSRLLQAYALMETKRPNGNSRKAIGLLERALKANPRDAGVLQAYALYVAELGDVDAARDLLRRGAEANKRHAPVWQAWAVLETRHGNVQEARSIFQEGIWACAQLTGGQSGGYRCARLWQAWGVLEAREGDAAAARRCFSRALDADSRNVAAVTAWALMEEEFGNVRDARAIYERSLRLFAAGSGEKTSIWRNYELMEQRLGHVAAAQNVYQRSMREAITVSDEIADNIVGLSAKSTTSLPDLTNVLSRSSDEVEVLRWEGQSKSSLGGEVWLNDRAIEGKVPFDMKTNQRRNKKTDKKYNQTP